MSTCQFVGCVFNTTVPGCYDPDVADIFGDRYRVDSLTRFFRKIGSNEKVRAKFLLRVDFVRKKAFPFRAFTFYVVNRLLRHVLNVRGSNGD